MVPYNFRKLVKTNIFIDAGSMAKSCLLERLGIVLSHGYSSYHVELLCLHLYEKKRVWTWCRVICPRTAHVGEYIQLVFNLIKIPVE